MEDLQLKTRDTFSEAEVERIRSVSWFRRLFLPHSLRISERPLPLDLPECSDVLVQKLIESVKHVGQLYPEATNEIQDGASDGMLAELALQIWRLRKRVDRIDPEERRKERRQLEDSAARLERVLVDAGVIIDDPVGKPFVDGWIEVEVIAWDLIDEKTVVPPFPGPWIKDTIKPIVRRNGRVIGIGQVVAVNPE